ncbi:MAG: hypothetical protein K2R98_11890 [Gemmataceae bacterium]|nr:hypothetical protein [Gemmataceae bacterium]
MANREIQAADWRGDEPTHTLPGGRGSIELHRSDLLAPASVVNPFAWIAFVLGIGAFFPFLVVLKLDKVLGGWGLLGALGMGLLLGLIAIVMAILGLARRSGVSPLSISLSVLGLVTGLFACVGNGGYLLMLGLIMLMFPRGWHS